MDTLCCKGQHCSGERGHQCVSVDFRMAGGPTWGHEAHSSGLVQAARPGVWWETIPLGAGEPFHCIVPPDLVCSSSPGPQCPPL